MKVQSLEQWKAGRLAMVPAAWRRRVDLMHGARESAATDGAGRRAAGLWLYDLSESVAGLRVPITLTDSEIVELATRRAAECMSAGEYVPGKFIKTMAGLRARMAATVAGYGIKPPQPIRTGPWRRGAYVGVSDAGAVARMVCPLWWRRRLREAQARNLEGKAIELGFVHRFDQKYASDATVARRLQQKNRNAAALAATEARNIETGQSMTLDKLAAASVANPRIRRGELMTRIAGFEHIAIGLDHSGEFVTLTAPSKYHATLKSGRPNPKYTGATPRQTQGYIARVWARIRAALDRRGIYPYGFRIAEPHHDATPHWHLLLFMPALAVATFREVFAGHALHEDGGEAGAAQNRVQFVAIDRARGSAAGYIAKYVAKNIDGSGYTVQGDTEGGPGDIFPGHRVEAWASTWGIRQFQQVGGPPVGVWRELRRLEIDQAHPATLAAARAAADCGTRNGHDETGAAGNWRRYVEVMGGPIVRRADMPIRLAKAGAGEHVDRHMGASATPPNRYGETRPGAVYGLVDTATGETFATVRHVWEISSKGRAPAADHASIPLLAVTGRTWAAYGVPSTVDMDGFALGFDFGVTRSPVNNCTEGGSNGHARIRPDTGRDDIGNVGGPIELRHRTRPGGTYGRDFAGASAPVDHRTGSNHCRDGAAPG